ncbi:hypothetical protein ACRE_022480 [Hapsidospora chrysogenum ATCC 11550]|uniref:Invertebrate defensins family profile domain-containing protein n=1 Tax=Hapsidospora chrysogenum (strain ATCC 11550 / CBS 779.69 / DSM 880 / IAM 14645 / JCM 23072 / IMI 49137) TaxID=857340 RepID=A0A086TC73_HAPC1|nr:hypothetical protein ACRE_022480 [Hapsidospora chrysogenum ATCC 11550]
MKAAFVLAALATLVVAAPQLEENIPYAPVNEVGEADVSAQLTSVDAVSLHSSPDLIEPLQYCGGLTASQCSNACYWLGYRCYRCTSSVCQCSNSGC